MGNICLSTQSMMIVFLISYIFCKPNNDFITYVVASDRCIPYTNRKYYRFVTICPCST